MVDLAVILVTWNVRDLVLDALRSLYDDLAISGLSHRVYVVDNASSDGTAQAVAAAFPEVVLTASETNLGFGAGNNLALRQIGFGQAEPAELPRAVFLLNCDTITKRSATRTLFDALMSAPDVGLVGAQLEFGDGRFQHGAFAFPGLKQLWAELFPTPGRFIDGTFNGRYPRRLYAQNQPFPVDFPLGATMMLKREVIQQTGMFDEDFFMYGEEIDWAWRIHRAGWRVMMVPAAHIVHFGAQSTSQVKPQSVVNLWTSRLQLFDKYFPTWKRWLARRLVALGMTRKMLQINTDRSLPNSERHALANAYQQVRRLANGG
jgi:N-acetylglucosaminyl-diphospho-decaprenol L-rhamnosyltransferase